MKVFNTTNNDVTKFIHNDGSETAIKNVVTCSQDIELNNIYVDRKKYTIFISTTVGCFMKCNFCHLTLKNSKYIKLSEEQVLDNLKEAIKYKINLNPEVKNNFIKLSWMGMGDALIESEKVKNVTIKLLDWVIENNYAKGLDGVDLSTVFPEVKNDWISDFNELNVLLSKYTQNTNNNISVNNELKNNEVKKYKNRTPFRLFYSIHTLDIDNRKKMIPHSMNPFIVVDKLINPSIDFNVIFHYLFVQGENDSRLEVDLLKNLLKEKINDYELRILRYNFCDMSPFKESVNFKDIIKELLTVSQNIKVQISPGSEVKAACGQFIVDQD